MMGILVVKELILSHNLGRFIKTPLEKPNIFNIFIICSGKSLNITSFNPIQDGYFRGCSRMGVTRIPPCPSKICRTYPTMMKLGTVIPYLKKIQKILKIFFHRKSASFVISRNTDIDCILVHNF